MCQIPCLLDLFLVCLQQKRGKYIMTDLYSSLPQYFRDVLDGIGLDEAAKKIDAEVAEYQARVFAEKEQNNEQSEVDRFKEEFTKTKKYKK